MLQGKLILLILLLCFCAPVLLAQSSSAHVHATVSTDMIDGSTNPQAIPDIIAYRLYFFAVSNASPKAMNAHLKKALLADNDVVTATAILVNFKSQYAALIDEYNKSPEVANGSSAGLALFMSKRDALVNATRDALRASLTPDGLGTLQARVQAEKSGMKVAAAEAAQEAQQ